MLKPYIAITGIKIKEEACVLKKIWHDLTGQYKEFPFEFMIGILSSSKRSLEKNLKLEGKRSPAIVDIPDILKETWKEENSKGVFPAIHFHTRNRNFYRELKPLMDNYFNYDGAFIKAIQLNISNPSEESIVAFMNHYPTKIVYQLNNYFLKRFRENEFDWKDGFNYCPYILIDGSGGRGIANVSYPFIVKILEYLKQVGYKGRIGYAGGIKPNNVTKFLFPFFPNVAPAFNYLSIDSESGLRTDGELDLNKCRIYLINAVTEIENSMSFH